MASTPKNQTWWRKWEQRSPKIFLKNIKENPKRNGCTITLFIHRINTSEISQFHSILSENYRLPLLTCHLLQKIKPTGTLSCHLFIYIKRSKTLLNSTESMAKEQQQQQQKQHFHVLAVDDSLLDRKLLERLLKISSYQGWELRYGFYFSFIWGGTRQTLYPF